MSACKVVYPAFPRVCGKYSPVLARLITEHVGPRLQLDGQGERIQLVVGTYQPPGRFADHTYMRYFDGAGSALLVDYVYPLLWGGGCWPNCSPIVVHMPESDIDEFLARELHLWPYDIEQAKQLGYDLYRDGSGIPPDPERDYHDTLAAANSDAPWQIGGYVTASGQYRPGPAWGHTIIRAYEAAAAALGDPGPTGNPR
jgi:hypothetical protein